MIRRIGCELAVAAALLATLAPASAQYPNRAVTMVVPLPPGDTADLLCRLAAERASGVLGQQVVVENRAGGAGGRVGTEAVLRAAPDGYTLLCAPQLAFSIAELVGTGSRARLKDYPDVATIAETLPGVYADTWMAVAAPPGTPSEITAKIADAIGRGFKQPDLEARILALEAEPLGGTPSQMRAMIRQSRETWGPVVEAAKIVVD